MRVPPLYIFPLLLAVASASCGMSAHPWVGEPPRRIPSGMIVPGRPNTAALFLTGTILNGRDGSPLPGATVRGRGRGARSDRHGHYELRLHELPGDNIRIRVTRTGFEPVELNVQVVEGTTPLDITLLPESPPDTAVAELTGPDTGAAR